MLQFWNKMAEVSAQHLKLDDVVYVSGGLRSYLKLDEDGSSLRRYTVWLFFPSKYEVFYSVMLEIMLL